MNQLIVETNATAISNLGDASGQSMAKQQGAGALQGGEIHGEGQAHRKEREEPCGQCDGGKGDEPVEEARDDLEAEGEQPAKPASHG